jgi:hypothetical protein
MDIYPDLADPGLHRRHWTNIDDDLARNQWVEPDLDPMP